MNVSTALKTDMEATEVQPGIRAFDDPAILAKVAAMFGTALGDSRLDIAIAQRPSTLLGVAPAIGVDHMRSLQYLPCNP